MNLVENHFIALGDLLMDLINLGFVMTNQLCRELLGIDLELEPS